MSGLLIIRGTTLATAASVVREGTDEVLASAANPVVVVGESNMFRGVEVMLGIGNLTVEVTLSGADRLALIELLLGHRLAEPKVCSCGKHSLDEPWLHIQEAKPGRITESEARALDGNR